MKRFAIALILALVCAGLLCVAASAEIVNSGTCGVNGDILTWTLDDEGVLTISGTGEMENYATSSHWGTGITRAVIEEGVTKL